MSFATGPALASYQVRLVVLHEDVVIDPAACPLDCERQEDGSFAIFYPGTQSSLLISTHLPTCASVIGQPELWVPRLTASLPQATQP